MHPTSISIPNPLYSITSDYKPLLQYRSSGKKWCTQKSKLLTLSLTQLIDVGDF